MAPRESFKIDKNDPDLQTFEQVIANFHPEFYALKQNGQPSYEHPDFCKRTLEFKYIPGNKEPYDIFSLNIMTESQADEFINNKLHLLGVSLSQKVKTSDQERKFKEKIIPVVENVRFNGMKGAVTISECMEKFAIYTLRGYINLIIRYFKFKNNDDLAVRVITEEIDDIKERCSFVSNKLYNSSESMFLNKHSGVKLTRLSRYSIFTRLFIHAYNQRKYLYIDSAISSLKEMGVNVSDDDIKSIDMINYVDVILLNELSNFYLKLERIEKPNKNQPKERVRNPAEFAYKCHFSGRFEDTRNTLRKLFMKAWAYSYLKDKDISANQLAIHISNYDEFFYSGECITNGIEDYLEIRRNTLNDYFYEWRKQYKRDKNDGYLSILLNDKRL
ncbi:hypothetical protein [Photobacterium damselae]|uniref:hypothetical protein n=1 Tax=Photobacterium damselae TaxID=38293 RepID=UPI002542EACF|nr:hypothetical protein [Photobacterium damselae]WIH19061.1 hypothetical protein KQY33_12450 [Photobacterium damselae]